MRRMSELPVAANDAQLLALADQCVMCGLCLPHCPTYRLDAHEAESPRGRIALARLLARGGEASPKAVEHLDHCLGCLSCQKVCPSQVQYGKILVSTRARLASSKPSARRLWRRMSPAMMTRLAAAGLATRADRWMPMLARILPVTSLWRRIATEMPRAPSLGVHAPAHANAKESIGTVTLFRGCVASVFDDDTLAAARALLEAVGYRVLEPAQTLCCGALARHAGETVAADKTQRRTRRSLASLGADDVLVSASGCLGSLRETAVGTSLRIDDVAAFLVRAPAWSSLRFRPLAARGALHLPCTQISVGDGGRATRTLLARIPGLDVIVLPDQPRCCGAAGTHFLEFPERADRLRAEKLEQVAAQCPSVLLTSNVGCRVFLDNGLRRQATPIPVLHPLALLARQLDTSIP